MVAIAFVPHAGVRVGHVLHGFFVRTLGEPARLRQSRAQGVLEQTRDRHRADPARSEEHTSELQSLMRISYAVFCLKKKRNRKKKSNRRIIRHKIDRQSQLPNYTK